MINILKREPLFKKLGSVILVLVISIFCIFTMFQYNNLKNIYLEQNEINKRIIGTLVNKYPQEELAIIKSVYNKDDKYSDLGNKTLNKFGYNKDYKMYENVNFQQHLKYFLVNNLIIFVILISFVVTILSAFMRHIFNKLLKVNKNIESIIHNNYKIDEDFKEVGIFNIINSDLNKLSKSLNLKVNNLDKEKEEIKELVTDISHQLKTPLASLKLYNTLLLEEDMNEEDKIEFLQTNEMSINKLHNLIDSLVNISRLETSMISIKKENKSIKNTISKAINSVKVKASQKNINLNLENFEDEYIPHDSKWTEECIFNILENGVKYSNENEDINIYIEKTINFLKINIKDNGIGIHKSEFNNIFKRFYRSEEVQAIEGSGVGLYLSRKILERQGGNIIVSSQKGQGSKFSLFLTKV
jgi:signal transduction histidine kinase